MSNLPKGWNLLALNQICDLQNGYAFKSNDYVNISNTLNCRMSNIRPNGFFDLEHNQKFLPDSYTQKYQQYLLKDGDVIIAMTDMATEAKILGVPTIVETQGKNLLLNQRVGKLIIKKPELIYFPYLKYVLNREQVKKYFLKFAGGGLQINLGKDDILSVEIPLPPLAEQKRIAEILDRAQELRSKRRDAIAQLDTLTQAIFLEMFGDPVSNPKGWDMGKTLGEVAEIVSGITKGRKLNGQEVRDIPYLAVVNVQDRRLDLTTIKTIEATENEILRYKLQVNDLLLTEGGDPDKLGRGTLWNGEIPECIHQNHIFRVRITLNLIHPLFLNWLIGSQRGKKYFLKQAKQTTGIATINMTQLRGFSLLIPPFDLQQEFARRVEAVEKLKASHYASLSELNALFASLQHRAFRGEL